MMMIMMIPTAMMIQTSFCSISIFQFICSFAKKGKTLVLKSIVIGQFPDGHNCVVNITTLKDDGNICICPLTSQKLKWQQV